MSRQVQVLKQAGLVVDCRQAQRVRYWINQGLPRPLFQLVEAGLERETSVGKITG